VIAVLVIVGRALQADSSKVAERAKRIGAAKP
jgi:hypothetical protein